MVIQTDTQQSPSAAETAYTTDDTRTSGETAGIALDGSTVFTQAGASQNTSAIPFTNTQG